MRAKHAREIRAGIQRARDVIARRRQTPKNFVPMQDHARKTLFQRAYEREVTAMVHDGRIKPPRGGSGVSFSSHGQQPLVYVAPPKPPKPVKNSGIGGVR